MQYFGQEELVGNVAENKRGEEITYSSLLAWVQSPSWAARQGCKFSRFSSNYLPLSVDSEVSYSLPPPNTPKFCFQSREDLTKWQKKSSAVLRNLGNFFSDSSCVFSPWLDFPGHKRTLGANLGEILMNSGVAGCTDWETTWSRSLKTTQLGNLECSFYIQAALVLASCPFAYLKHPDLINLRGVISWESAKYHLFRD